jgi:hypothetical protein
MVVFMDQAAKDVTAAELPCDQRLRLAIALWSLGCRQAEAAVRTMAVVVLDIVMEDAKQLPAAADQEMVQALPAHGANPALGDGIGVGRLDRCADDLGADRAPDVVEDTGELTVAESGEFSWRQSAHSGLDHSRCNSALLPAVRPERQLGAEPAPAGERRGHGDRR